MRQFGPVFRLGLNRLNYLARLSKSRPLEKPRVGLRTPYRYASST